MVILRLQSDTIPFTENKKARPSGRTGLAEPLTSSAYYVGVIAGPATRSA